MSVSIKSTEPITNELPAVMAIKDLSSIWKLRFKRGNNPDAQLCFPFQGDLQAAIKRGREYCLHMNYRFIHVEPFIVDLDASEKAFLGVPPSAV